MKTFSLLSLALLLCVSCSTQESLHPQIRTELSLWNQDALAPPEFCGNIVKIQYDPTKIADGAPTYYDNTTGAAIARCDSPMVRLPPERHMQCPPVQWTCP